ncbi:hypothetical protein MKW94_002365 [Papaver nudicaule]|uniref:RING-type domain-containing protein n=1 Tax=Papaver nudicaule TaxID=74823 RepID=A0AA41V1C3_PAPNU|nr:hypothetical protein [Papaver nudicaule]
MQRLRASKRNALEDLELRLGPHKEDMLGRNCVRGFPNLITIEDDDDEDDVIMFSQSRSTGEIPLFPITSSWVPIVTEEDLELRLGFRGHTGAGMHNAEGRGEPSQTWKCVKTKYARLTEMEGVKLRCTICMDTMKEETSTLCGHVFCKTCIVNAIRVQNRCPACRKEVSLNNIHRIYLPGATTS